MSSIIKNISAVYLEQPNIFDRTIAIAEIFGHYSRPAHMFTTSARAS